MPDYIDPEEFPFTAAEVARAGRLFLAPEVALEMAEHLAACSESAIRGREERRAQLEARGHADAARHVSVGWDYPEELLAALAALSPDCERRARIRVAVMWEAEREAVVGEAVLRAAELAGLVPTGEEIEALVQAERAPGAVSAIAYQLPPLPPPTSAMLDAGDARVRRLAEAWERQMLRFRERLPSVGVSDV